MSYANDGMPKHKIELPRPGQSEQYGGTRTVQDAYNYDVGNQIGEGTYGQVFTGVCKKHKDKVALKKIRMDTEKEGFPITAIREIKILSSMKHENVVNLREIVRSDIHKSNNFKGSIYMVFDYAEHDLTGLMDSCKYKFTEPQVKCIMKQLLKGLAYVHGNGVLHRDLKASNILIDKNGTVKLADFGLARTYQERQDARLTNRVITLWYRPPELLLGAEKYGPEVDMWSVGCILAELLVGKPLFPGKDEPDQLDRIFSIMGSPTKDSWPDGPKLPSWGSFPQGRHQGNRLRAWVQDMANKQHVLISSSAVDLLEKLLRVDPSKRIDALTAFQDLWFWNHDPAACEPMALPCTGSSHEFTMKKKRQERSDAQHAQQHQSLYPGHQQGGENKRARYGGPGAGGGAAGGGGNYAGASGGSGSQYSSQSRAPTGGPPHMSQQQGYANRGGPNMSAPPGAMAPPQGRYGGGAGGGQGGYGARPPPQQGGGPLHGMPQRPGAQGQPGQYRPNPPPGHQGQGNQWSGRR